MLSENDCRVTVFSQFIALLGRIASPSAAVQAFVAMQSQLEQVAQGVAITLAKSTERVSATAARKQPQQLPLLE